MHLLFVCTGNTCRSPMAEFLCKHYARQNHLPISCESAGIFASPNTRPAENAVTVLRNRGIDLTTHRAQQVTAPLLEKADFVIAMTPDHQHLLCSHFPDHCEKIHLFSHSVNDPYGGNLAMYQKTADQLDSLLQSFIASRIDPIFPSQ